MSIDRFLYLMLALSLTSLFGVMALAVHFSGQGFGEAWTETEKLIEQSTLAQLEKSHDFKHEMKRLWLCRLVKRNAAKVDRLLSPQSIQKATDASVRFFYQALEACAKYQRALQKAEMEKIARARHELFRVCSIVESDNDPKKIGDDGKAVGIVQIWTCVVDDVNKISSRKYRYSDRRSIRKSKEIFLAYLDYYGKEYQRLTKRQPTSEVLARIWQGGPDGWKEHKTKKYWAKASQYLNSI